MTHSGTDGLDATTENRIRTFLEQRIEDDELVSVSCGIYVDGETQTITIGEKDRTSGAKTNAETRYCIGSCTKSVVASAILQLSEQGKIDLSDPVTAYIDGLPESFKDVTIEHLLSHSSGIPSDSSAEIAILECFDVEEFSHDIDSYDGFLQFLDQHTVSSRFEPGERKLYYNTGYSLLGRVISTVVDQSFESYIREAILDPLGIDDAGFDLDGDADDVATGYLRTEEGLEEQGYIGGPVMNPAGGLFLSANGAASLMSFFVDGRDDLLGNHADELIQPRIEADPGASINGDSSYCLGMYETDFDDHKTYCHGGIVHSGSAGFAFDDECGVMIMFNSQNTFYPSNLAFGVLAILRGGEPTDVPYFGLREKLEQLEGVYTDDAGVLELEIEAGPPYLMAELESEIEPFTARLEPETYEPGDTRFWSRRENGERASDPIEFSKEDGVMTFYWMGHRFQRTEEPAGKD